MKMDRYFAMLALTIGVGIALALAMPADAVAAVTHAAGSDAGGLVSTLIHASPALIALRAQHTDLTTRAAALIATIKDGMPPADVTRIEGEHAALVEQAATLQRTITEQEAHERSNPTAPPTAPNSDAERAAAAERTRAADITDIGTRAGLGQDVIAAAIRDGSTVDAFRTRAFDQLAGDADRTRTGNINVTRDETQTRMNHLTDALTVRIGGEVALGVGENGQRRVMNADARQYARLTLAEMAATALGERSMPRDAAEREDVLRRAMHTTTDFPIIFESSVNRVLAARYALAPTTYRRISVRRNFRDFRPHDQVRVGDFPTLQKVGDSGEIKFGTFGESKETVAVVPYAIQFAISRRMLIDDNLGAIDQMLGSQGDSVARFEENTFYAMKAAGSGAGPILKEDNKRVFHTDHGNLAQTPSVIDKTNLTLARAAMRKQKNQSGALLNVSPSILLVGPDKETEAQMIVAQITATAAADVNPFAGTLQPVVGPIDGNAWELYADPNVLPVFVWGMLDGYSAPRLRVENPFGVQGVGVSLEHDFGTGAIDWRGGYRNAGA